jgi:ornithine decarboxylase
VNDVSDSPKFILSKKILMKQYSQIRKLCDQVSYSAKTNYEVARLLENSTDSLFSIHSLESLGIIRDKKRVWYLAQAWDVGELRHLFAEGVENFIVDNEPDLNLLLEFLKTRKSQINLLLRIRIKEHTIHTGKYFVYGLFSRRATELLPKLRENQNIRMLGIHFHRKTQNLSEWSLKYELEQLFSAEILQIVDLVNIGGGIPVRYKNFRVEVQERIFSEILQLRKWLKSFNTNLIVEPGRFIAAPCIKLQTQIRNIYDNNIIVDCSVYNSAMDTFVANIRLEVEGELTAEKGKPYTIKGKTPCSMDIFRYRAYLEDPKPGDTITFLNAGAYNFSTDFCNLDKIPTEIVEDFE